MANVPVPPNENDYVVSGAHTYCTAAQNASLNLVAFTATGSEGYETSEGIPALDNNTATDENFNGTFGRCTITGEKCGPDFLPVWYKSMEGTSLYPYIPRVLELSTSVPITLASNSVAEEKVKYFLSLCMDDWDDTKWNEFMSRAKYYANGPYITAQGSPIKYAVETGLHVPPSREGLSMLEHIKREVEKRKPYIFINYGDKAAAYDNAINTLNAAITATAIVASQEDKQYERHLLTMQSMLVCWNGGVVRFKDNGQERTEARRRKKIVVIEQCETFTTDCWERNSTNNIDKKATEAAGGETVYYPADRIVLHFNGATTYPSLGAINHLYTSGVSAHFVLTRSGRIVQLVDMQKAAWANGQATFTEDMVKVPLILERKVNPNYYTTSIECIASVEDQGLINTKQIEMLWYAMRYIRFWTTAYMGVEDIPFDRTWEDYPTLPPISSSVILTEAPYTGMTQHTRYFQNVVGHVYGHNDMTKKACPGSDFPWHEIMEYWEREEEEVEFIEWTRSLTKLGSTDDVAEDRLAFLRDEKGYNLDEIEVIC